MWDLDRDGITYSMLSRFLICRERFRLASVEGWTDSSLNLPLEFGNAFHECLEANVKTSEGVHRVLGAYMAKRQQGPKFTKDQAKDLEYMLGSIKAVYPAYVAYWDKTPTFIDRVSSPARRYYDREFHYLEHEATFDVPHTLPSGRVIRLRGKRDAGFINPMTGKVWTQENKTKGNIDAEGLQTTLHKDLQTMIYSYTFSQEKREDPEGVLYNVIRRPGLKPGKQESVIGFIERVAHDISKRPNWYFMRWNVEFDAGDIQRWVHRTLNPLLETVAQWWDSIKHNPFEPWTTPKNHAASRCTGCDKIFDYIYHDHPCPNGCDTTLQQVMVPNPYHFERPFGVYDSQQFSTRGEFYEPLTRGNFYGYYKRSVPFPELES